MATVLDAGTTPTGSADPPRVVICGSFRRARDVLDEDFRALLQSGCEVLSPMDVNFVKDLNGFALAAHELDDNPHEIERRHLDALQAADFVWLHAPDGYVGLSAALELGVADSFGIPVFCREAPRDVTLAAFVQVIPSPGVAAHIARGRGRHTPTRPLATLQAYYERMAVDRGFATESPQDTMLLLTEEVGELARAVRKAVGLARADSKDVDPGAELADLQLYVLHLANVIGVDLANAVAAKERVNSARYGHAAAA